MAKNCDTRVLTCWKALQCNFADVAGVRQNIFEVD